MQLQNAADGHGHKMSAVHSVWSASSSNASDNRAPVNAYGRLKHWWPSHTYHCTFCSRVFRTAQALGGHMNIHRRERACANDVNTRNYTRSTPTLSEPSHIPAASSVAEPGRPLFSTTHRLLLTTRPPPPSSNPTPASSTSHMENFSINRRLPSQPPTSTYNVSTHLQISANSARIPEPHPGGNGAHFPRILSNNNNSDPLTWLLSQLPPPGILTPPFQQSQSACLTNTLAKPYHRALAVMKSPPGVRRHVCRMSALAAQSVQYTGMHPRGRAAAAIAHAHSSSAAHAEEESLDLELRL